MKITNSRSKSVQQIFSEIQQHFPNAKLKKPFLSPQTIVVPQGNYKFLLQYKQQYLRVDFMPPVIWTIGGMLAGWGIFTILLSILFQQVVISIGGAIPVIIGLLIVKAVFKSTRADEFKSFEDEANMLVNSSHQGI